MKIIKMSAATILFTLLISIIPVVSVYAANYPKATGYVNDFAHLLTTEEGKLLNQDLVNLEQNTTIEVTVVTTKSLDGLTIEDYTKGLATQWGVGKEGKNNGVVFLIAPNERQIRIETATGIRSTLTDTKTNKIRDDIVIPDFKTGNMPKGVIDGTHAIITVLSSTDHSTQANGINEWTTKDTIIAISIFGGVIFIIAIIFIICMIVKRQRARNFVLDIRIELNHRLVTVSKLSTNLDVTTETKAKLIEFVKDFSPIDQLKANDRKINWVKTKEKLCKLDNSLDEIESDMESEVSFAEKARREGPKLMKKIPDLLEQAQSQIAKGKQSSSALENLKKAQSQYKQALNQSSGMSVINWVILYALFIEIQSNIDNAKLNHKYVNTEHPSPNYSMDDSSSPYGFGDSSGFGGGGGFDGGGGSSGSW